MRPRLIGTCCFDPQTGTWADPDGAFGGGGGCMVDAYTYSDMTGFGLANAGGWTPAG